MIAAHLRKERALTRCRYSVENCPPPPARERPVACYNFEKPRVRRVNRDACRRGAGAQLSGPWDLSGAPVVGERPAASAQTAVFMPRALSSAPLALR